MPKVGGPPTQKLGSPVPTVAAPVLTHTTNAV